MFVFDCEAGYQPDNGQNDVTDGSVDWYEMDWENVDNGVLESEMSKCPENPCSDSDTSR